MLPARVTVCRGGQSWQAELNPEGTVVGRSPACDVVIDSLEVSRRHARVFLEPSGGWKVKDLGSSNGTFVNGKRIESCPFLPGDIVGIGPASLSLEQASSPQSDATVSLPGPNIIVMDFGTEVFYSTPRLQDCPRPPCPKRLDRAGSRLAGCSDPLLAYREACYALADGPKTAAAVFRVPSGDQPLPKTPEVLACHFGGSLEDTTAGSADELHPSHRAFRVSHRLLDRVRMDGFPLMTKSIFSCDTEITVSLIDEHSPRALICASLGLGEGFVVLLYVDVPIDGRTQPGPEEMFAFTQAVARLVQRTTARILGTAQGKE